MGDERTRSVADIAEDVVAQDNLATACPIFVVQQRKRIYGLDSDYSEDTVWVTDDGYEGDDENARALEAEYEISGCEPDGWRRVAYVDEWEFVTACFTQRGCEEYLRVNGHNLRDPRIYVESGSHNAEWATMRKFFATVAMQVVALHAGGISHGND